MAQLVKYLSLRHEDRHRGPQDPCKADTSGSEHCFPRAFQNIYYITHSPFASISINTVHSPDLCVCQRQLEMPRAGVRVQMQLPGSPAPVHKFMYQNPAAAPHCQDSALTDQSHWESCCWKHYVRPGQGHLVDKCNLSASLRPAWCRVQTDFSLRGGQGWTETPHSINTWLRMRLTLHFCGT